MSRTTEAFSRVKIDALLKDAGWNLTDGVSILFEHALPDGSRADYVLCDRSGRPVAAVEAKRASVDPIAAQEQGRHYAEQPMMAEYRDLSSGYFDLVITDECHRSIYGKWSGVLRHFDGIQIGLTATPCIAEADTLLDAEDGHYVRDTLRFFELAEPTFRYTLRARPSTRGAWSRIASTRR